MPWQRELDSSYTKGISALSNTDAIKQTMVKEAGTPLVLSAQESMNHYGDMRLSR